METYAPAAGTRALSLGGRSLLYAEERQQLLELNAAADRIWNALATAGTIPAAVRELGVLGVPAARARSLAERAAHDWLLAGHLIPDALEPLLERAPDRTLDLAGLAVELRLEELPPDELDAAFRGLYADAGGGARRLTALGRGDAVLLYLERRLVMAGPRRGWIAHLKAALTDLCLDAVESGFLTHGALLQKDGRRLLLSGEPGAGKTTLALALAAAGWRYGGDDMVHVRPDGAVVGVPFAAAVKGGSLALLAQAWPGLAPLPAWMRADGREVRYLLPPDLMSRTAGPLDLVVTLARSPGADARAAPISPVDALGAIVGSACARRWRMTGEALCALAATLERAVCAQLDYEPLAPAVRTIEEIAGVQAQAA